MERSSIKIQKDDKKVCRLRATDILLIHTKRSLWGWIIRRGTHCYWNHALMVCSSGDSEQDYKNTLVIDAKTDGTVVMGRASDYLNRRDKYDVAVKRLRVDWFHSRDRMPVEELRRLICNIAVNEVNLRLRRRLIRSCNQLIRQFTVIFRFIRRKIKHSCKPVILPWGIRPSQVKAFTCGGFVQWCYYKAVSTMLEEIGGDGSLLDDVVFNPRFEKEPTPFALLTTTPADLANSDKLSWKYIIKNGVMNEISGDHDTGLVAVPV